MTSAASAGALLSAGVKGAIRGKLHADVFAARNKHSAQVITLPVGPLLPAEDDARIAPRRCLFWQSPE